MSKPKEPSRPNKPEKPFEFYTVNNGLKLKDVCLKHEQGLEEFFQLVRVAIPLYVDLKTVKSFVDEIYSDDGYDTAYECQLVWEEKIANKDYSKQMKRYTAKLSAYEEALTEYTAKKAAYDAEMVVYSAQEKARERDKTALEIARLKKRLAQLQKKSKKDDDIE